MLGITKLPLRLRSIFHKNRAGVASARNHFHLQNQIDEYVAQGMNPKEARHARYARWAVSSQRR